MVAGDSALPLYVLGQGLSLNRMYGLGWGYLYTDQFQQGFKCIQGWSATSWLLHYSEKPFLYQYSSKSRSSSRRYTTCSSESTVSEYRVCENEIQGVDAPLRGKRFAELLFHGFVEVPYILGYLEVSVGLLLNGLKEERAPAGPVPT